MLSYFTSPQSPMENFFLSRFWSNITPPTRVSSAAENILIIRNASPLETFETLSLPEPWYRKNLVSVLRHLIWFLFNILRWYEKDVNAWIALTSNFWIYHLRVHYHQLCQISIQSAFLSLLNHQQPPFRATLQKHSKWYLFECFIPMYVSLKTSTAAWTGLQLHH